MSKENPILLYIETSTEVCSVALSKGDVCVGVEESFDGNTHSLNLLPFMDALLKKTGVEMKDIDGVVVSEGPGSYTGLRIGVSTAKGIAYSLQIPVITVNTLESIANGCRACCPEMQGQIIAMLDARRMEVYMARYDALGVKLSEPEAAVIDEHSFESQLADTSLYFCGNGMPKCQPILSKYPNAHFVDFKISAKYMLPTALEKWRKGAFVDTAYFEPFYLKEYVAGKPKVKGLQ